MTTKRCRHCGLEKPLEAFRQDDRYKDGRISYCRACNSKLASARVARYKRQLETNPNDERHGMVTGYKYGCRCQRCRDAYRDYEKRKRRYQ